MDKRTVSKMVVRMLVATNVGSFVTKSLAANYPQSQKAHANEVAGYVAGAVAQDKLGPYTDEIVDTFWNRRAAKKTQS